MRWEVSESSSLAADNGAQAEWALGVSWFL